MPNIWHLTSLIRMLLRRDVLSSKALARQVKLELKGTLRHNVINSLKKMGNSLPQIDACFTVRVKIDTPHLNHSVAIFSKANQPSLLNYVYISMS